MSQNLGAIKVLISSYSDYHVVSSKEATRKRASGQAEVCRWVMILFIGFFTALVAFGIDEGIVQSKMVKISVIYLLT